MPMVLLLLVASLARAQRRLPVTVTVFAESVRLPDLRKISPSPNWGVRAGTEFYYRQRTRSHWFQTANLGYYSHPAMHHGFYLSTEVGYRKFIGPVFLDATLGGGYLHLISRLPVYSDNGNGGFEQSSPHLSKFMPTLGLGAGVRVGHQTALLVRYEVFGEMPIANEIPLLPHRAIHLGLRFNLPT